MMPDPDLSSVPTDAIAKALGQMPTAQSPAPSAPDLSSVPTSAIQKALGTAGNGSASSASGTGPIAQALLSRAGQRCDGLQCGQAISNVLPGGQTVTALRNNPASRVQPDAQGRYPNDTILYFAPTNGIADAKGTNQHYGVVYTGADGIQRVAEDTSAGAGGGGSRTYRGDRTVAQIAQEHGGNVFGFQASGVRGSGQASSAPDLSGVSTADIQKALTQGGPADGVGPDDYTPIFTPPPTPAQPAASPAPAAAVPSAPGVPPAAVYSPFQPDPASPISPADYSVKKTPAEDPLGYAFLGVDQTARAYSQAPTPATLAAHQAALQNALSVLTQSGALGRHSDYQQWASAVQSSGLLPSANPSSPAADPSGALPFVERIIGADGHKGTFHQQIDDLGTAGQQLWQSLVNPGPATHTDPSQYADIAADTSSSENAGGLLASVNRRAVASAPTAAADMLVPGGSQGMIAHGSEAAVQGRLPQFGKTLGAGIASETLHNPVGQLLNVVSLVGAAKIPLDVGAETLLGMGGKLTAAAEAADAAGNASAAAGLRSAAQKAAGAAQDMKVASVSYGRAVTGGKVGDYAANTAATIARKHFPGSGLAQGLTDTAMSRSLGKAVVDAYPGFKAARSQGLGRMTPQAGDVNIGGEPKGNYSGLGASASAAPVSNPPVNGFGGIPSRALLPGTSPRLLPSPSSSTASSRLPASPLPSALPLHPSAPGANGAARAVDGTFAPAPPATVSAPATPSAPAQSPSTPSLVPGFPVSQLRLDPDRFQYKIGYGQGGASGSLTDAKAFNPDFAGVVHAWRDPADGEAYVVNGHNRVGLAKRTGTPGMDVRFLDAPDAAAARTKGALINIAEGQGTALDAAKLFRETGYTQADLQRQGINLKGQKASQGLALANLSDPLFQRAMRGDIPVERAAIIGANVPDHGDQATLMKQVEGRSVTNDELREMAQAIAEGPKHTSQTASLFGTEEISRSLAVERAQAASYIKAQLAKDGGAFASASKNAERLTGGGNVIDAPSSAKLATQSKQAAEVFDAVKNAPGDVSDILNASAKRLARVKETGENPDAIKQDALRQFRQYAGQHFPGLQPITNSVGSADDAGASGSLSFGGSGGQGGSREGSAALGRPGGRVYESDAGRGRRENVVPGRQAYVGPRQLTNLSSPPTAALTPDGRQVALKGKSGTLYVNAKAYQDITNQLGVSPTTQGVAMTPHYVKKVTQALRTVSQKFLRESPGSAATAEGQQYLTDLRRTANLLRQGLGQRAGIAVVKVGPGQTLSETKAVARHERTHTGSYAYPLSQASRDALDTRLSEPSHPLNAAYTRAKEAMTKRGYGPSKTWDEIPAVLSAGPMQYSKMGLSDEEAKDLGKEYAKALAREHGIEGVRAVFSHGSATARAVAKQAPAETAARAPAVRPQNPLANTSPDEMRWLTLDEVQDIRKAGLLSSPKQVVKAVAGHVSALGADEIARLPAALTDFLISAATGRDRTIGDVRLQDLAQAAKIGATKGVSLGFQVMRHGAHGLAAMGQGNPLLPANHPAFHSGMRLLDGYVNGVFRMHEGAYASLKLFALHRALLELADVGAINAVRRGLIPKSQQEAFRQHLYNAPSSTMMAAAVSAAEEATLTNSNKYSEMHQAAYDKAPPLGRAVMNHLVAFPKIESNVAGRSLEMATGSFYAPLQFARAAMQKNGFTAGDQQRFSKTFGRGLVGLGLIALGVMIAAKKRGQPSDEKHHQPGYVQYGGRLYPTNTAAPNSNLLQLGIDLYAGRNQEEGQPSHSVGDAVANLLMEQPWAKAAPGDLTDILTSGKDAKKQLGQQSASYVPAFLGDLAAQFDTVKRKQTEPLDYVKNKVPYWRNTLPPALDSLGNPRPEVPGRLFNPFGGTPVGPSDSPAMQRLSQDLSARAPSGGLDALTPRQRDSLTLRRGILDMAAKGQDIRPALQSAVQSRQITLGQARHLVIESRMTTLEQKVDLLPLSEALNVYQAGTPAEKAQMQNVLLRKVAGAARSRSLMPQDLQKAQDLGIIPARH